MNINRLTYAYPFDMENMHSLRDRKKIGGIIFDMVHFTQSSGFTILHTFKMQLPHVRLTIR